MEVRNTELRHRRQCGRVARADQPEDRRKVAACPMPGRHAPVRIVEAEHERRRDPARAGRRARTPGHLLGPLRAIADPEQPQFVASHSAPSAGLPLSEPTTGWSP